MEQGSKVRVQVFLRVLIDWTPSGLYFERPRSVGFEARRDYSSDNAKGPVAHGGVAAELYATESSAPRGIFRDVYLPPAKLSVSTVCAVYSHSWI